MKGKRKKGRKETRLERIESRLKRGWNWKRSRRENIEERVKARWEERIKVKMKE